MATFVFLTHPVTILVTDLSNPNGAMTLEAPTLEVLKLEAPTLEALSKKDWRPGDIGGQATLEAYPSRGVGENIPRLTRYTHFMRCARLTNVRAPSQQY